MLDSLNIHLSEYYDKYPTNDKSIVFNDVQLTYYLVIDENEENSYKFIPVWVFAEYEDDLELIESTNIRQLLIINAVDGNIIDLVEQAKSMGFYSE